MSDQMSDLMTDLFIDIAMEDENTLDLNDEWLGRQMSYPYEDQPRAETNASETSNTSDLGQFFVSVDTPEVVNEVEIGPNNEIDVPLPAVEPQPIAGPSGAQPRGRPPIESDALRQQMRREINRQSALKYRAKKSELRVNDVIASQPIAGPSGARPRGRPPLASDAIRRERQKEVQRRSAQRYRLKKKIDLGVNEEVVTELDQKNESLKWQITGLRKQHKICLQLLDRTGFTFNRSDTLMMNRIRKNIINLN